MININEFDDIEARVLLKHAVYIPPIRQQNTVIKEWTSGKTQGKPSTPGWNARQ